MNIRQASAAYEAWLRSHLGTVREDLRLKHARMNESPFTFMRATFFRWAQLFPDKCRPLADASTVLGVGDLHIENFGTWRDAEGRLVWGVNDFDEADRVPFTNDLARLSTSATIAIAAGHLALQAREAAELILQGYEESLQHGGQPIVLAEHHHALGVMARFRLHDAERYWSTLQAMPTVRTVRPDVAKLLARALPDRGLSHRVVHRVAGLGSLGRERFVAIAEWDGGLVAREAKPLAPSAQRWATGHDSRKIRYRALLDAAIRCRDPFVAVRGRWLVRRLAPDCSRIDLADLPQERDEERLLHAMGWETANVHLGSRSAKRLRAELQRLPRRWLTEASKSMAETITKGVESMAVRLKTAWPGLAALTLAIAPTRGGAQGMAPSLTRFLQQTIGLQPDELQDAASGKPVVKLLESSDRLEIAVFGIVSVAVPRAFYVRRAMDFRSSLTRAARPGFGIFSDPAVPADVAALTVSHDDVQDLAKCRPGACKLKFSVKTITRLRALIDSAPSTADSVVSAYLRTRAIDYITDYRARGNAALVVYDDEDSATAAAQVFTAMVSRSTYMYQYAPSLEQYLKNYPQNRPAELAEVLFWSAGDLPGVKETITLSHQVVYAPPELEGCTLIVTKQLYADHYLDGAIALTAIVDQAQGQPGVFLVYLRRLHFDELPSGGLLNVRGRVIGKVRDATRTALLEAKTTNERAYAAASPSSR